MLAVKNINWSIEYDFVAYKRENGSLDIVVYPSTPIKCNWHNRVRLYREAFAYSQIIKKQMLEDSKETK